jgi:hypothetical protein
MNIGRTYQHFLVYANEHVEADALSVISAPFIFVEQRSGSKTVGKNYLAVDQLTLGN